MFLCYSWFAIRRDFVITQDVPGPSEARNSNGAKPVRPSVRHGFKHFNYLYLFFSV